jgi:hypothetical protein
MFDFSEFFFPLHSFFITIIGETGAMWDTFFLF